MTEEGKTIVAIATAAGSAAIGIIRISGPNALDGTKKIFAGFSGDVQPRRTYFGRLTAGEYLDDAIGVYYRAPSSYTGEDAVELFCHGSYPLLEGIVGYLIQEVGFTQAEGGDFTARAFSNGKLDLTQAEGVYDIINAQTQAEIRGAYSLLSGALKTKIESLQREIVGVRADLEAAMDYPEEDIEQTSAENARREVENILEKTRSLEATFDSGRLRREGIKVALIGKPNVGKSSLMNALLGYERAIVTPEAGTTRDTLTESYCYKGVRFVLTDTAGLREAQSLPEQKGVERAVSAARESDVAVTVFEAGKTGECAEKTNATAHIAAENKIDLTRPTMDNAVAVSALTGEGVEELKERIYRAAGLGAAGGEGINNLRQLSCVTEARQHLERATKSDSPELMSADLYDAYAALGRITGITGSDALAEEIFRKFCVGK